MEKVSVIIPSYNRFQYLLNAINSIINQTYKNIEIIVINDKSTQQEYYTHDWNKYPGLKIIHLPNNSRELFQYPSGGYTRNKGLEQITGDYICFLDDDDIFMPEKIEIQLNQMKKQNYKFSSTDGYIGNGEMKNNIQYPIYNAEYYKNVILYIFSQKGLILQDFPDIFTKELIEIHNCIITSSVMIHKDILNTIGGFLPLKNGDEDINFWLRILKKYNCLYIKTPLFYYDNSHGSGRNY